MSAISSVMRLKLLQNDLPLKVDLKDAKAISLRVILFLKVKSRLRVRHLKALSMLNFCNSIGVVG